MIIGIDASRSQDAIQKTGVEKVSDSLLKAFLKIDKKEECIFYTPKFISWLPQDRQKIIKRKRFWTVIGLSLAFKKNPPDVFFSPVHELPFFLPSNTFRFLHDVAFKKNPKAYSWLQRLYLNWGLYRSIKKCRRIFVSTREVKKDLIKFTQAKSEQIMVVGLGYNKVNSDKDDNNKGIRKSQLLYLGRLERKKNIINLIKAFELFSKSHPGYKLVLAGKDGFGAEIIKKVAEEAQARIEIRGYVDEEEKQMLLRESKVLVHVPFEEGFSFPLLEAFDFSLPVIASDIPVLREVGGNACYFVNHTNIMNLVKAIEQVVSNKELRAKLINQGKERLKSFSWEDVAQNIFTIIKYNH